MAEMRLHNNVAMPVLGLGTTHSGGYSHDAVVFAIKNCGYRLIDTARRYGNEEHLRKAIEESGVPREDLFLATKIWPTDYGFQSTINAFRLSRKRLGSDYLVVIVTTAWSDPDTGEVTKRGITCSSFNSISTDPPIASFCITTPSRMDKLLRRSNKFAINMLAEEQVGLCLYFSKKAQEGNCQFADVGHSMHEGLPILNEISADLYLLHWPNCPSWISDPRNHLEETWRALEKLYDCGRVRAIGVSNFQEEHLERLLETASIVPHVNQFEYHPYLDGAESLKTYCEENRIQPMGSCPLAKGEILSRPEVLHVAKRLGKTPAQVCIRYSIQNNVVAIPKSMRSRRLRENAMIYDWCIPEEDMTMLRDAPAPEVRCVNRDVIQRKIDDLTTPDGYKLFLSSEKPTQNDHKERELFVRCH